MNVISRRFADELTDKDMRDEYLAAQTRVKIAHQIRALRNQRGWSQGHLGEILGKPQSNVSRLEDVEIGKYTLSTLLELASAFDVGLVVEFVRYDDFLRRTHNLRPSHLQVQSFSKEGLAPLYHRELSTHQATTSALATMQPAPMPNAVMTGAVVAIANPVMRYVGEVGGIDNAALSNFNAVTDNVSQANIRSDTATAPRIVQHPRPSVALASPW